MLATPRSIHLVKRIQLHGDAAASPSSSDVVSGAKGAGITTSVSNSSTSPAGGPKKLNVLYASGDKIQKEVAAPAAARAAVIRLSGGDASGQPAQSPSRIKQITLGLSAKQQDSSANDQKSASSSAPSTWPTTSSGKPRISILEKKASSDALNASNATTMPSPVDPPASKNSEENKADTSAAAAPTDSAASPAAGKPARKPRPARTSRAVGPQALVGNAIRAAVEEVAGSPSSEVPVESKEQVEASSNKVSLGEKRPSPAEAGTGPQSAAVGDAMTASSSGSSLAARETGSADKRVRTSKEEPSEEQTASMSNDIPISAIAGGTVSVIIRNFPKNTSVRQVYDEFFPEEGPGSEDTPYVRLIQVFPSANSTTVEIHVPASIAHRVVNRINGAIFSGMRLRAILGEAVPSGGTGAAVSVPQPTSTVTAPAASQSTNASEQQQQQQQRTPSSQETTSGSSSDVVVSLETGTSSRRRFAAPIMPWYHCALVESKPLPAGDLSRRWKDPSLPEPTIPRLPEFDDREFVKEAMARAAEEAGKELAEHQKMVLKISYQFIQGYKTRLADAEYANSSRMAAANAGAAAAKEIASEALRQQQLLQQQDYPSSASSSSSYDQSYSNYQSQPAYSTQGGSGYAGRTDRREVGHRDARRDDRHDGSRYRGPDRRDGYRGRDTRDRDNRDRFADGDANQNRDARRGGYRGPGGAISHHHPHHHSQQSHSSQQYDQSHQQQVSSYSTSGYEGATSYDQNSSQSGYSTTAVASDEYSSKYTSGDASTSSYDYSSSGVASVSVPPPPPPPAGASSWHPPGLMPTAAIPRIAGDGGLVSTASSMTEATPERRTSSRFGNRARL